MKKFLIALIVILVQIPPLWLASRTFIIDYANVKGLAMEATIPDGTLIWYLKLTKTPKSGEVFVFSDKDYPVLVERVIAIPGDKVSIKNGGVFVNDEKLSENYIKGDYTEGNIEVTLGENEYYFLGDNRTKGASYDSREMGPINKSNIIGKVLNVK